MWNICLILQRKKEFKGQKIVAVIKKKKAGNIVLKISFLLGYHCKVTLEWRMFIWASICRQLGNQVMLLNANIPATKQ